MRLMLSGLAQLGRDERGTPGQGQVNISVRRRYLRDAQELMRPRIIMTRWPTTERQFTRILSISPATNFPLRSCLPKIDGGRVARYLAYRYSCPNAVPDPVFCR
jgi:hypothetical protein